MRRIVEWLTPIASPACSNVSPARVRNSSSCLPRIMRNTEGAPPHSGFRGHAHHPLTPSTEVMSNW